MDTQKIAFNKVAKIKTDLSLISDIDKAFDRALQSEKNLSRLAEDIRLDAQKAASDYEIVINIGKNALEKAKELGADDVVRAINVRIQDANASKKEMDSIVSKVKSFLI